MKKTAIQSSLWVLLSFLVGCGQYQFNPLPTQVVQKESGFYVVPPKVDLLMMVDDTGGMSEIYPSIQSSIPAFLNSLDLQKWDYHFATNPLTSNRSIPQIVGSVYDGNRGADWTPPFPGAQKNAPGTILSRFFRLPSTYTDYMTQASISNQSGSSESGFSNLISTLSNGITGTGFLRPDSMLVVVVMGSGNDTSLVNYCSRSDGARVPCEMAGAPACVPTARDPRGLTSGAVITVNQWCASEQTSFNHFKNALKSVHANTRFYSAVDLYGVGNCLGGSSYQGSRYMKMAEELGGQSYDICTRSVSEVLTALSQDLTAQRFAFRARYIMLENEPDLSTLVVKKFINGDSSRVETLKQDSVNGWTYAGRIENTAVIDQPILMNQQTGYAIALHGTAKLTGSDTASVVYQIAGTKSIVTQ